ncbi:hypothetical protein LIA77_03167 [Sarocladium implicatum]|nr:hypothetical protein LIA77_03167 [Sarocladium implicatum]
MFCDGRVKEPRAVNPRSDGRALPVCTSHDPHYGATAPPCPCPVSLPSEGCYGSHVVIDGGD